MNLTSLGVAADSLKSFERLLQMQLRAIDRDIDEQAELVRVLIAECDTLLGALKDCAPDGFDIESHEVNLANIQCKVGDIIDTPF